MRIRIAASFFIVVFTILKTFSQDKIYLANSTKQGTIRAVNENFITYLPSSEKIKTANISTRDVMLLFNSKGGYLIPSKMNLKEDKSKQVIDAFLKQDSSYWQSDRIFETDKSIDEGIILGTSEKEIEIISKNETKKVPRSLISYVIYKSGKHFIQSAIDLATTILVTQLGPYNGIKGFKTNLPSSANNQGNQTNPSAGTGDTMKNAAPAVLSINDFLPPDSIKEMERKTLVKTKLFGQYLDVLCDKSKPTGELNAAIELAIILFVNEDALVETSSVNRETTTTKKIRLYLNSLKQLKYDKIRLEWTNVQYADHLILAADGTYRGTVTFQQKFTGFIDNELKYQDVTKKQVEVIIKSYKKIVDGEEKMKWDILLGDVGVKSTH